MVKWLVVRRGRGKYYSGRALPQARNAHNQQNVRRRIRERAGQGERRRIRRENRGSSEGLQREFTSEEVNKCVAKLKNRKAAGAGQIVNECMSYGGEGMVYHDGYVA